MIFADLDDLARALAKCVGESVPRAERALRLVVHAIGLYADVTTAEGRLAISFGLQLNQHILTRFGEQPENTVIECEYSPVD